MVMFYPAAAGELAEEPGWREGLEAGELASVMRSTMREEYAHASDEELGEALENVLDSMSPAEAFNFGSALNHIGKSASRLASDPAFIQVVRTAAPIVGGAAGTALGGPLGTALGSKLGTVAANALPARAAPPSSAPAPGPGTAASPPGIPPPPGTAASSPGIPPPPDTAPPPGIAPPAAPGPAAPARAAGAAAIPRPEAAAAPWPPSSVAGGSAAAAQAIVLCLQTDVLRALLATALGLHGRQQVSGIPTAHVINLFREVLGQAAADADELMYLSRPANTAEDDFEDAPAGPVRSLYTDLLGADNLELAEAAEWDGLDRW